MRRPAGVVVVAILMAVVALFGIFGSVLALGATVLTQNPIVRHAPEVRAFAAIFMGLVCCFFVWCAWTVVGLFRMRSWARISTLVIGGIVFLFSALAGGALLIARGLAPQMPPGTAGIRMDSVLLGTAIFYFLVSLIGVWWMVYFNLRPVRMAFAADELALPERPDEETGTTVELSGGAGIPPAAAETRPIDTHEPQK